MSQGPLASLAKRVSSDPGDLLYIGQPINQSTNRPKLHHHLREVWMLACSECGSRQLQEVDGGDDLP